MASIEKWLETHPDVIADLYQKVQRGESHCSSCLMPVIRKHASPCMPVLSRPCSLPARDEGLSPPDGGPEGVRPRRSDRCEVNWRGYMLGRSMFPTTAAGLRTSCVMMQCKLAGRRSKHLDRWPADTLYKDVIC